MNTKLLDAFRPDLDRIENSKESMMDLFSDPKKYGAPTWEEFQKNPDKYTKGRKIDDKLAMVDESGQTIKKAIYKQVYYLDEIRCESLVHLERVAVEENIDISKCTIHPQYKYDSGKLGYLVVQFKSPKIFTF